MCFVWFLLQIPFFFQSNDVKFNAWLDAYHPPGLESRPVEAHFFSPPYHSEFVLAQFLLYLLVGGWAILRAFRVRNESLWRPTHPVLRQLRSGILQSACIVLFIFLVKLLYRDDTGDHLFATYLSIAIYLVSFQVVRQSGFFQRPHLTDQQRYKNSHINPNEREELLTRLSAYMREQKPFIQAAFSLPELAAHLNVSVHQLSQAINEGLGKSFFEMTAEHRIEEAKRLLKEQIHIKVEEIAMQVGYTSKSSFNTAFKKLTGKTPSEWRAS